MHNAALRTATGCTQDTYIQHLLSHPLQKHTSTLQGFKKYCAHLYHTLAVLKRYLPASLVTPLPNPEQINHTYTKSTPNHIYHHYAPFVTLTYTTHIYHHYAPFVTLTYTTHIIFSIAPTLSPLDLWTYPTGVTALLARLMEKLAGGPQARRSDSPTRKGHVSG